MRIVCSLLVLFGLFVVSDAYNIPNATNWNILSPGDLRSWQSNFYGVEGPVHKDSCNSRTFSMSSVVNSIGEINGQTLSSSTYMTLTTPPYSMEQLYGPNVSEVRGQTRISMIGYQECLLRSFYHRNFIFAVNAVFEGWSNVDLVFRHQQQVVSVLSVRNASLNDYHIFGGGGIIWEFGTNINQDWENLVSLFKNREKLEMAIIFITPETVETTTTVETTMATPTTPEPPITSTEYARNQSIEPTNNRTSILESSSQNLIKEKISIIILGVMFVVFTGLSCKFCIYYYKKDVRNRTGFSRHNGEPMFDYKKFSGRVCLRKDTTEDTTNTITVV